MNVFIGVVLLISRRETFKYPGQDSSRGVPVEEPATLCLESE